MPCTPASTTSGSSLAGEPLAGPGSRRAGRRPRRAGGGGATVRQRAASGALPCAACPCSLPPVPRPCGPAPFDDESIAPSGPFIELPPSLVLLLVWSLQPAAHVRSPPP